MSDVKMRTMRSVEDSSRELMWATTAKCDALDPELIQMRMGLEVVVAGCYPEI
jgi:hypothetical protein